MERFRHHGSETPIRQSIQTKICKGSAVRVEPVRTMGLKVVQVERCEFAPESWEDEGRGVINVSAMRWAAPLVDKDDERMILLMSEIDRERTCEVSGTIR